MSQTDSPDTPAPGGETQRRSRTAVGRVVSNGADKSVRVSIERVVKHPVYGKYIRRTTRVLAHEEHNQCRIGDTVTIAECRPVSRHKAWRVVEVLGRDEADQGA